MKARKWYDGSPRFERGKRFRRTSTHSSLWLIMVVALDPSVVVDHVG